MHSKIHKTDHIWGGPQASLNIQHHVCVWVGENEWLSNRQKPQNSIYDRPFKLYFKTKILIFYKKITKLWLKMWNISPQNGDFSNIFTKIIIIFANHIRFSRTVSQITIFGKIFTFLVISSWIFYKNPKFLIPRKVWMAGHRSFFAVSAGSIASRFRPLKRKHGVEY